MPEMAFLANEGTSTVNDRHSLKPQPIHIDEVMQLAQKFVLCYYYRSFTHAAYLLSVRVLASFQTTIRTLLRRS